MGETNATAEWSRTRQIIFRFLFAYLLLYNLTLPLVFLVFSESIAEKVIQPYEDFWNALVPWVGQHVFTQRHRILVNIAGGSELSLFPPLYKACATESSSGAHSGGSKDLRQECRYDIARIEA